MVTFKKTNSFANRGQVAEEAVQKYLTAWAASHPLREFSRLVDAKAAGRTIKAAAADFEFYSAEHSGEFGLIEVKQTEHTYRLERSKVPQLPRLRKRANCGGTCLVLVLHSTLNRWRVVSAEELASTGDKGSWNLSLHPLFMTAEGALGSVCEAFN